jgi:metallo-beta-lactamase family protein
MDVKVRFLGGAKTVTGSKYLLQIDNLKVLVDCGLFQGLKELRLRNREKLYTGAENIDLVIITHAHIDHTGYLPKLYKDGFRGRVICTEASRELMGIMLRDSAKLQEEEAEYARKKGYSKHSHPEPLYTVADVEKVLPLLEGYDYNTPIVLTDQLSITFRDAGHIIGSAIVEMYLQGISQQKKLVFSGDLGRKNQPILYDPAIIENADVLFVESTYGDRYNKVDDPSEAMARIVNAAHERGGCLLIPAFAVGRTQTILYYLKKLLKEGRISPVKVYMDSPMAINVTDLYRHYPAYHKLSDAELTSPEHPFEFPELYYVREQSASQALNDIKQDAIIISASGMCNGGRILHHLYNRLPRPNDTILLAGYQAEGTRGRTILEGEPTVKMFGQQVSIKCHVEHLNVLSAHADKGELLQWLSTITKEPKWIFIIHGEEKSSDALAIAMQQELDWNPIVPEYMQMFELFTNI